MHFYAKWRKSKSISILRLPKFFNNSGRKFVCFYNWCLIHQSFNWPLGINDVIMGYAGHICAFRSRNSVGNFCCLSMSNGILNLAIQGPKVGDTESYKQISNGAGSNISAIHFGPLHLLKVTKYVLVLRDWAFGYNYRTYLKALLIRRLSNGHQPFGRKK